MNQTQVQTDCQILFCTGPAISPGVMFVFSHAFFSICYTELSPAGWCGAQLPSWHAALCFFSSRNALALSAGRCIIKKVHVLYPLLLLRPWRLFFWYEVYGNFLRTRRSSSSGNNSVKEQDGDVLIKKPQWCMLWCLMVSIIRLQMRGMTETMTVMMFDGAVKKIIMKFEIYSVVCCPGMKVLLINSFYAPTLNW